MPGGASASQDTLISTFDVSTIDISLAKDSNKKIESIKLKKNGNPINDYPSPQCANGVHRMQFDSPLALDPSDIISVSVDCSWTSTLRKGAASIQIDINLHDIECRRDEQGMTFYRKRTRNIEVLITGCRSVCGSPSGMLHASGQLSATTTSIIQSCSQFRLLIIGNSGVGKSTLIRKVFGVEEVDVSDSTRGNADIDREFISPTNKRFVVHDSLGFEAGDERNMETVKEFVGRRRAMPRLKDQLHAVWLCLEIPHAGGRLLEAGVEKFLENRKEILGEIPFIAVLTKVDVLDIQLQLENETLEHSRSRYLNKHCIKPLREAAGNDITYVTVSAADGYSESLSKLINATEESMAKYHVDEAPRIVASIAQRVSIKEKIESSITVGKKKYWKTLLKSAVFRGHTLQECLQVIHQDIITIWNMNDPDKCLMNDSIVGELLRTDNLGDASEAASNAASFAAILASSLEMLKGLSGSGEVTLAIAAPIAGLAITLVKATYEIYQEAKKDVKILMDYIVGLTCVMQVVFLLTSNGRDCVTPKTVTLALRAYETPRRVVHQLVNAFDGKLGVLPGGRDHVLEKIEELIWRHSVGDDEIEGLKQKIKDVLR